MWIPNEFAKNAYDAYDKYNKISSEYFVDFDETALSEIEVGDSFNLPLKEGNQFEVIVTNVEELLNDAIDFTLVDAKGNQRGSFTRIDNRVEGYFIGNDNQEYFLRAIGGVGWIAPKDHLIDNIRPKFRFKGDENY